MPMKKLFVVAVILLALASNRALSQAPNPALEKELITLEKQSWEAWKNRDGDFFNKFLSDDHVEIHPGGVAGKAAVLATVRTPNCVVNTYSLDGFKLTQFSADAALLTYYADQNTLCNGVAVPTPVWTGSLFIKRDGHWVNAAYQHTKAAGPPKNG
jgi:hypothetical protein